MHIVFFQKHLYELISGNKGQHHSGNRQDQPEEPRALLVHTSLLAPKTTRNVQGVAVMTLKPKYHLDRVLPAEESGIVNLARYRTRTIPAAGAILKPEDRGEEQLTLL